MLTPPVPVVLVVSKECNERRVQGAGGFKGNPVDAGTVGQQTSNRFETKARFGMGRQCTVCISPLRQNIEEGIRLARRQSAIAKEFGVSTAAIQRHRAHIPTDAAELANDYVDKGDIAKLKRMAQREYDTAKDPKLRIAALQRLESLAALEMRLGTNETEVAALTNHPAWQLFLKQLLGIVNDCTKCSAAITGIVPGDTRS